jgi:ABC-type sugar transport system, periplasmic component
MKSKVSLVLALFLTVTTLLMGCGSGGSDSGSGSKSGSNSGSGAPANSSGTSANSGTSESSQSGGKELTIANVPKMIGIAWWDRFNEGNKKFSSENPNVNIFQTGATQPDASQQVRVLEDVIAQKVDGITVIPNDPTSVEPVLKKAMDQGIIVVSHEASMLQNVHYDLEAFKNADYGAHLMDQLAELIGEEGEYAIMVGGLTMQTHIEWADGAVARQKEKYPNMKLVTDYVESGAEGQQGAYEKAKELIAAYPNLKGIIGMDAVNPPGIALAIEETGNTGKIVTVGTSLVSMSKQYLENGSIAKISFWDPALAAEAMAKIVTLVAENKEITDGMDLGVPGYNSVLVDGKVIYGSAWIDVTTDNMGDYNF